VPSCDLQCDNGGTCVLEPLSDAEKDSYAWMGSQQADSTDTMHCKCPSGFDGLLCEVPKIACGGEYCYNGGTCVESAIDGQIGEYLKRETYRSFAYS
jgi:hypothetical protein